MLLLSAIVAFLMLGVLWLAAVLYEHGLRPMRRMAELMKRPAAEIALGTSPLSSDTDGDGLSDYLEVGGIVVEPNPDPFFVGSVLTNLTADVLANADQCVDFNLTEPVSLLDETFTRLSIDANGLVYLRKAGDTSAIPARPYCSDVAGASFQMGTFAVAGYWSRLSLSAADPASSISVKHNLGFTWVEYSNMRLANAPSPENDIVSFQVVIPNDDYPFAILLYQTAGVHSDGRLASVGAWGRNGAFRKSYCYCEQGRIADGMMLYLDPGYGTNPRVADSDADGIDDGTELALGTRPDQPDTDDDGMNDGWEHSHGFDPCTHNRQTPRTDDDGTADPDGDGMTNAEECEWGTDPRGIDANGDGTPDGYDTDGDGVSDGAEIGQGSDPGDATDLGAPNSRVAVPFYFGDPSGSHSEKYILDVTPEPGSGEGAAPRAYSWLNANYDQCETKTAMLKPGWRYEVRMRWASCKYPNDGVYYPNYDYTLALGPDVPQNVVLDDPDNLFRLNYYGGAYYGADHFPVLDAVAKVSVCVVTNVSICNPDGSSWEELEEARVVLDDEELRIKIDIVPQIASLAQCRQAFGYFVTVKTAGTCPSGSSVLIGDDTAFVNSSGKSEIRISKTRQQLISLGLLPSDNDDGVNEMTWYDVGDDNLSSESNLSDSRAFAGLGYQLRGQILKPIMGNLNSDPPISINSGSFYKSAGCEIITAHFGEVDSKRRQIMNQADFFYYSGHGRHSDGSLMGLTNGPRLTPSLVSSFWNRDLKCVVFAGCSVLDINDYNGNYDGTAEHTSSPGKLWANVEGPTSFLGYAYKAPRDTQGADRIVSAWVANRGSMSDVDAWMHANDNRNGRNACTVQRIDDSHVRYSYFKREKGFLYNSYFSTNVIERITQ